MRRLTGSLLTLCLMLSLGCIGLWIRSYFEYDVFHYEARSGFQTNANLVRGKVVLYHANLYWDGRSGPGMHYWRFSPGSQKGRDVVSDFDWSNGRHFWNPLGFKLLSRHGPFGPMVHIVVVSAPLWALAAIFAAFPALQFVHFCRRRWLARNRQATGRCVNCGYDLRASRDYCPECGTSQSPLNV